MTPITGVTSSSKPETDLKLLKYGNSELGEKIFKIVVKIMRLWDALKV